jgi:hypothetical protein
VGRAEGDTDDGLVRRRRRTGENGSSKQAASKAIDNIRVTTIRSRIMGLEKYESPARDRNEIKIGKFYISANCPMFDFDWRFHSFILSFTVFGTFQQSLHAYPRSNTKISK